MASCDWQKFKTPQEVYAQLRHSETGQRLTHTQNNKHINKDITQDNMQNRNFREATKAYRETMERLDSQPGANLRKDRVTMFGLEIPLPAGLCFADRKTQQDWFNDTIRVINKTVGGVLVGDYAHFDEVHEYIDKDGNKQVSRPHLHHYVIPEVDGKLNGKAFSARDRIVSLNNEIELMTERKYHCKWLTGKGTKSRESVEELKMESEKRAIEQAREELEQERIRTAQRCSEMLSEAREEGEQEKNNLISEGKQERSRIISEAYKERDQIRASFKKGVSHHIEGLIGKLQAIDYKQAEIAHISRKQVTSERERFIEEYEHKIEMDDRTFTL